MTKLFIVGVERGANDPSLPQLIQELVTSIWLLKNGCVSKGRTLHIRLGGRIK